MYIVWTGKSSSMCRRPLIFSTTYSHLLTKHIAIMIYRNGEIANELFTLDNSRNELKRFDNFALVVVPIITNFTS